MSILCLKWDELENTPPPPPLVSVLLHSYFKSGSVLTLTLSILPSRFGCNLSYLPLWKKRMHVIPPALAALKSQVVDHRYAKSVNISINANYAIRKLARKRA